MDHSEETQSKTKDIYTIKELVTLTRSYLDEIRSQKKILLLTTLLGIGLSIFLKQSKPKIYEAEVSFMLNEEQPAFGGVSSMIGQFGGLLGSGDQVNLHKILDLAKSRRIAEKILFKKVPVEKGGTDYLANVLIEELEEQGKWAAAPFYNPGHPLKGFRFKSDSLMAFQRLENMALLQTHQMLLEKISTRVSEKTNLMYISITSIREDLAHELALNLFEELSQFYINKTVEKQEDTYRGLQQKTDSLKALLDKHQYKLADLKDSYRGSWLLSEDVPKTLLDQDIRILQLVYAEAMKNKEMASFALINKTPFIQAVDLPILPLKSYQMSWPRAILMGLICGLFVGFIFIGFRKMIRDSRIFE
ncbi:MAG: hypothetical protein IPM92_13400 [Saprospiraceae bacterium]|nr:hypothetical protein [Saprospiraceae bacterium]